MIQSHDFPTLESFISHLKTKKEIVGILQYGSRDYRNMGPGGDYDMILIVSPEFETEIGGLHFHINQIPVDCGIISQNDLSNDEPPSDFHCLIADATVLYDPTGFLTIRLLELKPKWQISPKPMPISEIAFERFIKQHMIDKFEGREYDDPLYTQVFLSGNIFFLLEVYMKIHQLNPYDFKGALQKMKSDSPETYALFEAFNQTTDLKEKVSITKQINQAVLANIGGPWKENEILFHYLDEDANYTSSQMAEIIALIF